MDDRIFFSVVIYLFLSTTLVGLLPDSFHSGVSDYDDFDNDELSGTLNMSGSDIDSFTEQRSFFSKAISFLLVTWTIDGIPTLLAVVLNLVNLLGIFVIIIYFYDKARGIGS